jgi:predicted RNA-binding protein with TRAM domain
MFQVYVAAGVVVVVLVAGVTVLFRRRRSSVRASDRAHEAAQGRDLPVELGERYEVAVSEFTDHHSGDRVVVGKLEGFVLFVEELDGDGGIEARRSTHSRG